MQRVNTSDATTLPIGNDTAIDTDTNRNTNANNTATERRFLELRRKVREAELLNAATEKLLLGLSFTGKLTVIIQNGRILKSGYEEGYFKKQ